MDYKNTELNASFSGVKVHPNAYVDPSAELHDGVIVSQGAIVGPDVTIGKGTETVSYTHLTLPTSFLV